MPFVISKLPMKNLYSVKNGMTGRTTANASTLANAQAQVRLMNSAEYGDAVGGKLLNSAEYADGNIEGGKLSASDLKGLLDGSYDGRKEHNGFKLDGDLSTDKVKVYYKMEEGGKRAVVAHRGTEGLRDWGNNLAYAIGGEKLYKKTDRYKEAARIQKKAESKYGVNNVSTIGHSQGGLAAELVGKKSKEIITLNKAAHPFQKRKAGNQTDIRSDRDVVSWFSPQDETIAAKSYNPLEEHSPNILDRVLDRDTEYGRGLSSIKKVQKLADKYEVGEVMPSTRKGKKYMVLSPLGKKIHFGASSYQDFTGHMDEDRRKRFQQRNKKWATADKYTPAWLSYHLLW